MSEWIDVKHELPPNDDDVLIVEEGDVNMGYRHRNLDCWMGYYSHGTDDANGVTHWMPLPAKPIPKRGQIVTLKMPEFKSEAEEANWWDNNPDLILKEFETAAKDGTLGRGTLKKRVVIENDDWDRFGS